MPHTDSSNRKRIRLYTRRCTGFKVSEPVLTPFEPYTKETEIKWMVFQVTILYCKVYWTGYNKCLRIRILYESCPIWRIDHSTCWSAVQFATTVPWLPPAPITSERLVCMTSTGRGKFCTRGRQVLYVNIVLNAYPLYRDILEWNIIDLDMEGVFTKSFTAVIIHMVGRLCRGVDANERVTYIWLQIDFHTHMVPNILSDSYGCK